LCVVIDHGVRTGDFDMARLLVNELGADVDEVSNPGRRSLSPLFYAALGRRIDVMRYLVEELGASINAVCFTGDSVLIASARHGRLESVQYLLEHGGANLTETDNAAEMVWDLLTVHMRRALGDDELVAPQENPEAMTALLRVMVLRGSPPPALVALLLPAERLLVDKGAWLRAQLPAYLTQRRALLNAHILLIPPLQALVHSYESDMPATTDEIWAQLDDLPDVPTFIEFVY
jgi:hypothetical protein